MAVKYNDYFTLTDNNGNSITLKFQQINGKNYLVDKDTGNRYICDEYTYVNDWTGNVDNFLQNSIRFLTCSQSFGTSGCVKRNYNAEYLCVNCVSNCHNCYQCTSFCHTNCASCETCTGCIDACNACTTCYAGCNGRDG